jgi:hypothetical protein
MFGRSALELVVSVYDLRLIRFGRPIGPPVEAGLASDAVAVGVRATHWRATTASSSARLSKCRLTIGSSRWTHSVSAGWSSGV